jgi:hypothetical protein
MLASAGTTAASPNFSYLGYHDPRLSEVATRAERVLGLDPVAALGHLRLFGELLAKHVAARLGVYECASPNPASVPTPRGVTKPSQWAASAVLCSRSAPE